MSSNSPEVPLLAPTNDESNLPESSSSERITVLTLNCWGVFLKCMTVKKDRRFAAICQKLNVSDYDILLLQEVWEMSDYRKMQAALSKRFPHSIYFHNQVFGSGLCIFSRWPLHSFITYPYNLNGYPHYVHQSDWAAGKSLGYTNTITPAGFRLNIYVTHTHARYEMDHDADFLKGHRLSQAIELMEFVRATAAGADALFIGGDLNLEPYTTAIKLLKKSLKLKDAWLDQEARNLALSLEDLELEGCTCEHRGNPFANPKWTNASGNGLRLDYLLYRPGNILNEASSISVVCESCRLEMQEIPDASGLHYSDHSAVVGDFLLTRHSEPVVCEDSISSPSESIISLLLDAQTILFQQAKHAKRCRIRHFVLAAVLLILMLLFGTLSPICHPAYSLFQSVVLLLTGALLFCLLWGNLVGRRCELNALQNMQNIVAHYVDAYS